MNKATWALLAAVTLATAACSSSNHAGSSASTGTIHPSGAAAPRARCTPPADPLVKATRVPGSTSDYDLVSFDGTRIRMHWLPLASASRVPAPTVLKGPGWGSPGDTNTSGDGYGLFGDLSIPTLQTAGYNVLTWDPRGFGKSGGRVEIDSPGYEGRDMQRIIDWVAHQPGVQLDAPNDPRMGMVGASYGGGIQLVAAAVDCRVDALVPQIAWHSLGTSLYEASTVKQGWGDLLYSVAGHASLDPHITSAHIVGDATGALSPTDQQWFLDRGPGDLVNRITAPTLFEQGTIDTLFPLDEAVANFDILRSKGVPTAMLWMCSGHGACLTPPGDVNLPGRAAINWLARYVKGETNEPPQPLFEYVDQTGTTYRAGSFPPAVGSPIQAVGSGTLTFVAGGGSGPAHATGNVGAVGGVALAITPAKAAHAVNVPFVVPRTAPLVGAPQLRLTYSGSAPAGVRPTRIFAQLVDDSTGIVMGNQITPIAVTLDGRSHTIAVPLEMVAFTAKPNAHLTLQLVATTTAYGQPRLGGSVTFSSIQLELPAVTDVSRS